jgi:hypothetical protein
VKVSFLTQEQIEALKQKVRANYEKKCEIFHISVPFEEFQQRYEWLHPVCKIICDFGQCNGASMVKCKKCNATLCLEHMIKHLAACGSTMEIYAKMRYEQEVLDGKIWDDED